MVGACAACAGAPPVGIGPSIMCWVGRCAAGWPSGGGAVPGECITVRAAAAAAPAAGEIVWALTDGATCEVDGPITIGAGTPGAWPYGDGVGRGGSGLPTAVGWRGPAPTSCEATTAASSTI